MQFTGKNLVFLHEMLELAKAELHNEIATCPDVVLYAEDIAACKTTGAKLQRLLDRVDHELDKE